MLTDVFYDLFLISVKIYTAISVGIAIDLLIFLLIGSYQ